jgi:hypothetical protein
MSDVPFPFSDRHPKFRVHGWSELLGPHETIDAADMVRHFIAMGETGSGKSVSAVMRLLEAILRYPEREHHDEYARSVEEPESAESLKPSVLVIDPKQELCELVAREAQGRNVIRIVYGETGPALHLFEGKELSRLEAPEAVDFILQQSDFYVQDMAKTDEPIWSLQAGLLLRDFVAVDMWLARTGIKRVTQLWDKTRENFEESGGSKSVSAAIAYDRENYFRPMAALVGLSGDRDSNETLAAYLDAAEEMKVPGEMLVRLISLTTLNNTTRSSVIWIANGILSELSLPEFAACVSVNPIEPPAKEKLMSVKTALDEGHIVVYVPTTRPSSVADIVARCLKAKFFEFSFERENKVRPFFYVVDEAQRFITAGAQDGEQSLLDRCRAFRTGVVLATQSMASLAYRLETARGGGRNALQIILNNCANALYFRTSDVLTQEHLRERIPEAPVQGRPHVVKVRPLTSLPRGSCYALQANGSWGIFQVHLASEPVRPSAT